MNPRDLAVGMLAFALGATVLMIVALFVPEAFVETNWPAVAEHWSE